MKKSGKYLSESARKFLDTPKGNRFFAEISNGTTRQAVYEQKKSFLEIPANVRRWLDYRELVEEKAKKGKNNS